METELDTKRFYQIKKFLNLSAKRVELERTPIEGETEEARLYNKFVIDEQLASISREESKVLLEFLEENYGDKPIEPDKKASKPKITVTLTPPKGDANGQNNSNSNPKQS